MNEPKPVIRSWRARLESTFELAIDFTESTAGDDFVRRCLRPHWARFAEM